MGKYLDFFPKIRYDLTGTIYSTNFNTVTNILFRIGMVKEYLNNTSAYYEYVIVEGDKPEILAEKVYGDAQAHWIILLANDIVDPQYDWPLGYDEFNNYIIGKYGSVANAKTTIHHYEKVITRENSAADQTFTYRYNIDYDEKANNVTVPYDTYLSLPDEQSYITYEIAGKTVTESIFRNSVTNYDYEVDLNESKRNIKIIKAAYYQTILREFENFVVPSDRLTFLRTLS